MHYLEKAGLGMVMRGTQLSATAVTTIAGRLLGETRFRDAAQAFAQRARRYQTHARLRQALERLLPGP
jgi:UDP:flavonoid glycosyltransferase YjiC (YdhE family)